MSIDLDFQHAGPPPLGGAVDLDFGHRDDGGPVDAVTGRLRARLGGLSARLRATYDNQVSRKLVGGGPLPWQRAVRQGADAGSRWSDAHQARGATGVVWAPAAQVRAATNAPIDDNRRSRSMAALPWADGPNCAAQMSGSFDVLLPTRDSRMLAWQQGARQDAGLSGAFIALVPQHHHRQAEWGTAAHVGLLCGLGFAPGVWQTRGWHLPWQRGRQPPFGESQLPVVPPVLPPPTTQHPTLDFRCKAQQQGIAWRPSLLLNFSTHPCAGGDEPGNYTVPILKVYLVSNHIEVVRLPGREPVPVRSLQIGLDADSWAWGLSASLPYAALELVAPTADGPVEMELSVNGVRWTMLVEAYDVRREFGASSVSVRGRSLAAYLAEPYAPKRSFVPNAPFTAQQLAGQELARVGLDTGFALDWRIPDWLVPAGAWSYEQLSPMSVITRIAESVGGYANADPRLKTIVVKPRYPSMPWEWATQTPDRSLPIDVVKTLDLRWQQKPAFDGVIVSGERHGVSARLFRSGTAGSQMAPMVVDALLTHADACRERGRSILGDTGKQATVTLDLPMVDGLGLLDPGMLLAVGEGAASWRGLVRATRISADWSQSLVVRQTVELERHYL